MNFVPALAYLFCLNLPAAHPQPGNGLIEIPCTSFIAYSSFVPIDFPDLAILLCPFRSSPLFFPDRYHCKAKSWRTSERSFNPISSAAAAAAAHERERRRRLIWCWRERERYVQSNSVRVAGSKSSKSARNHPLTSSLSGEFLHSMSVYSSMRVSYSRWVSLQNILFSFCSDVSLGFKHGEQILPISSIGSEQAGTHAFFRFNVLRQLRSNVTTIMCSIRRRNRCVDALPTSNILSSPLLIVGLLEAL